MLLQLAYCCFTSTEFVILTLTTKYEPMWNEAGRLSFVVSFFGNKATCWNFNASRQFVSAEVAATPQKQHKKKPLHNNGHEIWGKYWVQPLFAHQSVKDPFFFNASFGIGGDLIREINKATEAFTSCLSHFVSPLCIFVRSRESWL